MKSKITTLFLLITTYTFSQVGFNTTTPQNDVHVNGVLQVTNEINLGGDASTTGNAGTAGQYLVSQGAGLPPIWASANSSDHDWYEALLNTAPTSINSNVYTLGNVGIGLNNPQAGLEILTDLRIGTSNTTSGTNAIAIGNNNKTDGNYSFTQGTSNLTTAPYTFLSGNSNVTQAYNSTVFGSYNAITEGNSTTAVATDPLFQVGNGTSTTSRSNALTLLKNGYLGLGFTGPGLAALPTEMLDIGSGNVRIRDLSTSVVSNIDRIVVADENGVLKALPYGSARNDSSRIRTITNGDTAAQSDYTLLLDGQAATGGPDHIIRIVGAVNPGKIYEIINYDGGNYELLSSDDFRYQNSVLTTSLRFNNRLNFSNAENFPIIVGLRYLKIQSDGEDWVILDYRRAD